MENEYNKTKDIPLPLPLPNHPYIYLYRLLTPASFLCLPLDLFRYNRIVFSASMYISGLPIGGTLYCCEHYICFYPSLMAKRRKVNIIYLSRIDIASSFCWLFSFFFFFFVYAMISSDRNSSSRCCIYWETCVLCSSNRFRWDKNQFQSRKTIKYSPPFLLFYLSSRLIDLFSIIVSPYDNILVRYLYAKPLPENLWFIDSAIESYQRATCGS